MSGECDACGEHTLDCLCVGQDIYEENIDVYITMAELEKLRKFCYFLQVHHYPAHHPVACKEMGKIKFLSGPTLKFHLKRTEIPIEPVTAPSSTVTDLKKVLHSFECDCQECLDKWERLKQ